MPARAFTLSIALLLFTGLSACDSGEGFLTFAEQNSSQQPDPADPGVVTNSNDPTTADQEGLVWNEHAWDEKQWQ